VTVEDPRYPITDAATAFHHGERELLAA